MRRPVSIENRREKKSMCLTTCVVKFLVLRYGYG